MIIICPIKISVEMKRFYVLLVFVLLVACATTSRVPIHKIVGSPTVRTKVVLLKKEEIDTAYQRTAVREFEAVLLKQPVTHAMRATVGGEKVDLVLITRKEVQTVNSIAPEDIVKLGRESDVNTVIVVEPVKVDYRESSLKRGEEFCVVRRAKVVISAKVFETKGGEVVLAGVYEGSYRAHQCSKGIRRTDKLPSEDLVVLRAIKEAASKFSGDFWRNL